MIARAADGTGEAADDALDQRILVHHQLDDIGEATAAMLEQQVERVGLRRGARIAVEDRALPFLELVEALADQGGDDRVGDELARLHHRLRLQPHGRARLHRRAQHVAGGQLHHPAIMLQTARLRTLAGARRSEQDDVHVSSPLRSISDARGRP